MRRLSKILLLCLLTGLLLQGGFSAFALVNGGDVEQSALSEASEIGAAASEIQIPQQVLDRIKAADLDSYERNVSNYKELLVSLDADDTFKREIERLVLQGYALPHILIGYEFLYQSFGLISELELLVSLRTSGRTWAGIFSDYRADHPPFVPRTFESDDLERFMNTPGLTSDDIMIADQVSFTTGAAFEDVLAEKTDALHWKPITARKGVLYSADTLPRVQVTMEQLDTYTGQSGLTEDRVIEAFVLAHKLGQEAKDVIDRFKAGDSEEAIFADICMEKYE